MHYTHVDVSVGSDSIGWHGLPSDPSVGCLTPPPFGEQCTLPRSLALAACLSLPGCVAFTCPSQEPYQPGGSGKVKEPICQLRSRASTDEKGHGMCRPSGCVSAVLTRRTLDAGHEWAMSRPPRTRLVHLESITPGLIAPLLEASTRWPGAYHKLAPAHADPNHLQLVAVAVRARPWGGSPGRRLGADVSLAE